MTCCNDGFCRADCSSTGSGGGSGTGGGSATAGGSGGGAAGGGSGSTAGGGTGGSSTGGGTGGGAACVQDQACTSNPGAPCKLGTTSCNGQQSQCVDAKDAPDGTTCQQTNVCVGGMCTPCVDDAACATNPNKCVEGALKCSASGVMCNNTTKQRTPGTPCGVDQVCNPAGTCINCKQDDACTGNPGVCRKGRNDCSSGTPTCLDGDGKPAGTSCGMSLVCDGDGGCVTCTDGAACSTNPDPCKNGQQSCTGTPACNDTTPKMVGDSCGTDRVCNPQGACVMCPAGNACNTNMNECRQGRVMCGSGAAVCADGPNKALGTPCTGGFCASGACVPCALGMSCTGNPNACRTGTFQRGGMNMDMCGCGDDAPRPIGQVAGCNMGTTCNGAGGCVACGVPCDAGICRDGSRDCATLACTDKGLAPDGTPCPTGQCAGGTCCGGCRTGMTCQPGTSDTACGSNGLSCRDCTPPNPFGSCVYRNPCDETGDRDHTVGLCMNNSCTTVTTTVTADPFCDRRTDNRPCGLNASNVLAVCTGGQCRCGCFSPTGGCAQGDMNTACGNTGMMCATCAFAQSCRRSAADAGATMCCPTLGTCP